jgi:hypothetical protein
VIERKKRKGEDVVLYKFTWPIHYWEIITLGLIMLFGDTGWKAVVLHKEI